MNALIDEDSKKNLCKWASGFSNSSISSLVTIIQLSELVNNPPKSTPSLNNFSALRTCVPNGLSFRVFVISLTFYVALLALL